MKINRVLKKNRGFTLVELIVVIVIIAILAAITVPALVGYIDKAKNQQLIAECRQSVVAAQAIATESYAAGKLAKGSVDADGAFKTEIVKLAEVPSDAVLDYSKFIDAAVTELSYTRSGKTVLYKNGVYSVVEAGVAAAPSLPKTYGDVNDPSLTPEQKEAVIKSNAEAVLTTLNAGVAQMLQEADPNAVYHSRGQMTVNVTNTSAVTATSLYDSNGKQIGTTTVPLNLGEVMKGIVATQSFGADGNKAIDTSKADFGYTKVNFESVKVDGKTMYSSNITSFEFRGNALTGGSGDTSIYVYDVATKTLTKK